MRVTAGRQVEAKVKELREVAASDDSAAIKAKIEELQKEVMAIGQVRSPAHLLLLMSKHTEVLLRSTCFYRCW